MMATTWTVEDLYEQYIRPLTLEQKLRLLAKIAEHLSAECPSAPPQKQSIMELHGLGAEIWKGIDAQEYVNQLREEWSHQL